MSTAFLTRARLFNEVLVNAGGNSGNSPTLDLQHARANLHVSLRAASIAGAADVKLEFQQSPDNTNWDGIADNPDITSSTSTDKPDNREGYNEYTVPALLGRYVRFLVTGVGANPADTLVTLYAFWNEGRD